MGIPLTALQVNPPEQNSPLQAVGRAATLQGMLQGNKMRQMELDEATAAKKENDELQKLFMETQGDVDKLVELAPARGVRPQTVLKLKAAMMEQKEKLTKLDETTFKNAQAKTGIIGQAAGAILAVPPEQRPQVLMQALQGLAQQGIVTPDEAKQYAQLAQAPPDVLEQQLRMFQTAAVSSTEQYRAEAERRQKIADAAAKKEELTAGQKEFADFYEAYRESQDPPLPKNAKTEMAARDAFRKMQAAPRQPVPGVDVPLSPDVEQQRTRMNPPTDTTRGMFITLTDEDGNVIGAWNPKTKQVEQIPEELAGTRKGPLSDTARSRRALLSNLVEDIDTAKTLAEKFRGTTTIGAVTGKVGSWKRAIIGGDEDAIRLERITNNASDILLRARSGAQINEQEYQRLVRLVPQMSDSEDNFFTKLKDFSAEIKRLQAKSTSEKGPKPGLPKAGQGTPAPAGALPPNWEGGRRKP